MRRSARLRSSRTNRVVKTQTLCVSCPTIQILRPHAGALYGRYELLDQLRAYKVRPAEDVPPHKFETGTKNHEGLAGTTAAINYLADLGAEFGAPFADQYLGFEGRRLHLKTAMAAIRAYERPLAKRLISGVTIYGITDPARFDGRAPTVAFTLEGYAPHQVAERLGQEGIFVWDGNYYALAVTERLGVEESGGMVRVGSPHYIFVVLKKIRCGPPEKQAASFRSDRLLPSFWGLRSLAVPKDQRQVDILASLPGICFAGRFNLL
jgi:hypothetical protein